MSGNEVAIRNPQKMASGIPAKLQYAHELAESGMLPRQYRHQPANVLWAVEYGEMLGLAPMAAITGVHVIEGTPSASAGLISALVRRAGHKLRVRGDSKSATCQIVRSDDPDYTFEVTWTLKRNAEGNPSAEEAGLLGKNIWKQYPASMLKSRAITQCARDACEEALFGLHYTPEELGAEVDEDGVVIGRDPFRPVPSAEGDAYAAGYRAAEETAEAIAQANRAPENAWLAAAMEQAPKHATLEACQVMWRKSAEMVKDREITRADADRLRALLFKRMEELKDAPPAPETDGEVVDAEIVEDGADTLDGDWADKVADITSDEDGAFVTGEANDLLGSGEISDDLHRQIHAAVEARLATLTPKAA